MGHVIKRHRAAAKFLRRISLNDRLRQGVRSDMGDRQRFPRRVRAKVLESPGRRVSNPIAVSNWSARKAASRAPPDPSRWPARRRSGQTRSTDTRDNAALRIRASRRAGRVSRALAWRRHVRLPAARLGPSSFISKFHSGQVAGHAMIRNPAAQTGFHGRHRRWAAFTPASAGDT